MEYRRLISIDLYHFLISVKGSENCIYVLDFDNEDLRSIFTHKDLIDTILGGLIFDYYVNEIVPFADCQGNLGLFVNCSKKSNKEVN